MEDIRTIKQRFEIIGNDIKLNRAIEKAVQVAPTDFTVLITGESGVGKEIFPRIIHSFSARKHAQYIAVNCGVMKKDHSRERLLTGKVTSRLVTGERFS